LGHESHFSAAAWFSGEVRNVVKAVVSAGDCRLDIILVAYTDA
jgi:hypothetical protein